MDPIATVENVQKLYDLLMLAGTEVVLNWQLAGHNLTPEEVREASEWLALQRARV
jgi:predicted esterase